MTNQTKLLDVLGAGGVCLVGLALLDVAIAGLKRVTEITSLWKSCGVIGGVLLAAYVVLGVFDRDSYLRQAARGCWGWLWSRLRRRKEDQEQTATDEPSDSFFVQDWKSPDEAPLVEASTNGPVAAVTAEGTDDEDADEPALVTADSPTRGLPR